MKIERAIFLADKYIGTFFLERYKGRFVWSYEPLTYVTNTKDNGERLIRSGCIRLDIYGRDTIDRLNLPPYIEFRLGDLRENL